VNPSERPLVAAGGPSRLIRNKWLRNPYEDHSAEEPNHRALSRI